MNQFGLETYRRIAMGVILFLIFGTLFFKLQPYATSSSTKSSSSLPRINKAGVKQLLAGLPLVFELNKGQAGRNVKFVARGPQAQLLLESNEAMLLTGSARFRLKLAGANAKVKVRGDDQLIERRNYLLGNDEAKWQTDVPTFKRVIYEDVYRGINLTYYGNNKQIEYDFAVAPGADPSA